MAKKKKLVRVHTEKSQGPWNRTKKQAKKDDLYRKQANRIVELEKQVANLATGNSGKVPITIHVTVAMLDVLNKLTSTGFWGMDREQTASQMVAMCIRAERYL